ncbi:MAG: hypothetical protein JJ899_09405, partial [Alphaproteobacteria bacterium]|nr:hypothetical protein [Alphaproteobacteria bacterium]
GPGMDNVRWVAPVRPGDTLSTVVEVKDARASKSDPRRGVVTFAVTVSNADGEVATFDAVVFARTRAGAAT